MTTISATRRFDAAERATTWQLAGVEARRMLLHPSYLFCLVFTAIAGASLTFGDDVGDDPVAGLPYAVPLLFGALFYPLTTVVAANRVAASTQRRSPQEVLGVTPTGEQRRTFATCVALLRGPVLVGLVVMLFMDLTATVVPQGSIAPGLMPRGVLEHLQIPVTVLGGGLLGIAVARWAKVPGLLALVVVGLWFGHMVTSIATQHGGPVTGATWLVLIPTWLFSDATMITASPLSQEMWHLVYLLGLSLLAGVAALLHAPERRRPLLMTGAVLVVVTGVAAVLQMG